jgi:hypothetical protein
MLYLFYGNSTFRGTNAAHEAPRSRSSVNVYKLPLAGRQRAFGTLRIDITVPIRIDVARHVGVLGGSDVLKR